MRYLYFFHQHKIASFLLMFILFIFSAIAVAHSINKYAEIYTGISSLPFEVIFEKKVIYESFDSFRGNLADSYGRISLASDGKSLMFYDFQIKEPRTYIVYLNSNDYELIDEGEVWAYGWEDKRLVLAKEFDFKKQSPSGNVIVFDSSIHERKELQMKEPHNLVRNDKWGAVSHQIQGDRDFYDSKIYSPDGNYYMKMRIETDCFLNCAYSIVALDFFKDSGEKLGEYIMPKSRILSRTYFSDSWAPDNTYILLDRSFAEPVALISYDGRYYPERLLGKGPMLSESYSQIWTVKKIKMSE